jgi:SAM-dependent methyltransferase
MKLFNLQPRTPRDAAFADVTARVLADRLADVTRTDFSSALWVGGGSQALSDAGKAIGSLAVIPFPVEGEIEQFPYPENSLDLIVVNGTLNRVNDLPGALIQMRRALKSDGLFLCALPGGETLYELRDVLMQADARRLSGAAMRVHPMVDLQTFAGLMQRAGFALPVVDSDIKTVFYRRLETLLHDIKASGEGMALLERPKPFTGKTYWRDAEADYRARFSDADGLLRASFEIIYGIGWGPAATQQQPLRPGSAKTRLADALGSVETALPDRAKPH